MKKTIYIFTFICLLFNIAPVKGQKTLRGISIDNITTARSNETMDIGFIVRAADIEVKNDDRLILEFAVENDDRRLVLPVVVYSGAQRYRYEERRTLLAGGFDVEPYAIYRRVKKKRNYKTDYKISLPYSVWMEHAAVTYRVADKTGTNTVGVLVADINAAPMHPGPEEWAPDMELLPHLVSFLVPEAGLIKTRVSVLELRIDFPVNATDVRTGYGNNRRELERADSLVRALSDNDMISIDSVNIRGYASPEGAYEANERLARGRSESFKRYLRGRYPQDLHIRNARTSWVAEDWQGLARLVEADGSIADKQDVLAIVYDNSLTPDTKDRMLKSIGNWSDNYRIILTEMYPKLRRIELKIDYTVRNLDDSQARSLLYTNPGMLSLDEIYRVAQFYEPGSRQYREVYEIAASQYPDDVTANNNVAAARLQAGNAQEALPYLEKTKSSDSSLINYGVYYYITGELEKAIEYTEKAKKAGNGQAAHNLELIRSR